MKKSRLLIAGSAISLALFSAMPSYAQDAQPDAANAQEEEAEAEEALEEGSGQPILVTGSRIARPTLQSAVPLTSVTIEDLTGTGELSLGDALNDLPSLRSTFSSGNSSRFIGTAGLSLLDLRGLGTDRTLVLVNGRRWISSLGATVDLNTIPTAAVERIEVLKDGASAVYGSDAIAGVVNIITRKDFEGVELSVYAGENASEGDGRQYSADLTFGVTGAKGGLLFNLSHVTQQPIWAGDREISAFGNSSTTEKGRIRVYNNTLDAATVQNMRDLGYTERGLANNDPAKPETFNDDGFDIVPNAGTGAGGAGCRPLQSS